MNQHYEIPHKNPEHTWINHCLQNLGALDKPVILALHGWLDNASSFDLLAPFLEPHFHIIAIDLPGHGLSSHLPPGSHYHFIDAIFTLNEIVNAFKLKEVHLLGHSMGACLASLAAGVMPDRFLSLALIEALGPFSSPEQTCKAQLSEYLQNQRMKLEMPYSSLEAAAKARAKSGYLSIEYARILCERGVGQKNDRYYWQHDRRLAIPSPLRLTEEQVLSCLTSIKAKSCLILAEQGFDMEEHNLKGRIQAVKNLKVHKLQGGHHLHMEHPDIVAKYLLDFFKK